jgi:DNA polymerase-3 subunit epsilon
MRKIVFDAETTGVDPDDGHRIVELAAIEIIGNKITDKRFHRYFNPERKVTAEAEKVHGLSFERLQNEVKFSEEAPALIEFISGAELIIFNAPFDIAFLNSEFERADLPHVENICKKVTDTLLMAEHQDPDCINDLDALCERYGVDSSKYNSHGALLNAELLAEVYLKMSQRALH